MHKRQYAIWMERKLQGTKVESDNQPWGIWYKND